MSLPMFHRLESSACQRSMPTLPASVLRFRHDFNSKKDVGDLKRSLTLTDMSLNNNTRAVQQYICSPMRYLGIYCNKTIPGYFPGNSFSSNHSYKPEITSSSQDSAQEVAPYCTGNNYLRAQKKIKKKK